MSVCIVSWQGTKAMSLYEHCRLGRSEAFATLTREASTTGRLRQQPWRKQTSKNRRNDCLCEPLQQTNSKQKPVWQVCRKAVIAQSGSRSLTLVSLLKMREAILSLLVSELYNLFPGNPGSAVSTNMEHTLPSYTLPAMGSGCPVIGVQAGQADQQSVPAGSCDVVRLQHTTGGAQVSRKISALQVVQL